MLRVFAALFVLGMGVIAWVLLTPDASRKTHLTAAPVMPPAGAAAAGPVAAPPPATTPIETAREIRVVYPGPDGTAQVRKLSDKVAASAPVIPVAAPVPAEPVASPVPTAPASTAAQSGNPSSTVMATAAETSAAMPAPAGTPALNINTASVEALNQIPGAGRIGRTIASHRPYHSVEDLLSRRVVRKSVYDVIRNQVAAN